MDRLLQEPEGRGVNPSAINNQAIWVASMYGHLAVVERLLQEPVGRGVDPSANNNIAIRYAHEHGFQSVVDLLATDVRVCPIQPKTGIRSMIYNYIYNLCF